MLTITLQDRVILCTLAVTTAVREPHGSGMTEVKAMMIQQVVPMLQQGHVRQLVRPLLMHPQIEPAGFKSQTTSVGLYTH